jgi:hypothetical protein
MTAVAEYSELEARILAVIDAGLADRHFNELALAVHEFQRRWNAPYAKWCGSESAPKTWREIPVVPQAMFKAYRISCFSPDQTTATFLTSGTTGETRGAHHFLNTRLYHAAALAGWRRLRRPQQRSLILTQSPADAPNSSLVSMFGCLAAEFGGEFFCDSAGRLDFARLERALQTSEPVALFGTALAFLNLFEWLGERRIALPAGSYALETGGFKGSGREIPKADLYALFEKHLALRADDVINEYGMCELSSQFYTNGLGGLHTCGPWMRALVVSPVNSEEVALGGTGVLRIFDLANLGSSLAIQTGDLAIRHEHGFELLGRAPSEPPRGCSRMADEQMRATAANHPSPNKTTTNARIAALAEAAARFPFLGDYSATTLTEWLTSELGDAGALDDFTPAAGRLTKAIAPKIIVHILSGNTPAAALQTLIRGLLLGARNLCKLPSSGLPEVGEFIAALPPELQTLVECSVELPEGWLDSADAVIVFGSDATISHFRKLVAPEKTFVGYGHKVSFGVVFDDPECTSADGAARDASLFDQQGCLSPHVFFVAGDARNYAAKLAAEMERFAKVERRGPLAISEHSSIRAMQESIGFRAANGEDCAVFSGEDWTVIFDSAPGFPATPLNRVIFVKPLPADLVASLAHLRPHLSACGIFPATPENARAVSELGVSRICQIGAMQSPKAAWHHDGQPSLARLVRWVDFEN